MKRVLSLWFLLLLASCAPASRPQPATFDLGSLPAQLASLPGAVVDEEGGIKFSYPDQSMFGEGAVLPLPGGIKLLDPLADFFLRSPGLVWKIDVQTHTEYGPDYDQTLAEKRSELLATYLLSKEVDLRGLQFHPLAAAGDALVFTLNQPQQAAQQ